MRLLNHPLMNYRSHNPNNIQETYRNNSMSKGVVGLKYGSGEFSNYTVPIGASIDPLNTR